MSRYAVRLEFSDGTSKLVFSNECIRGIRDSNNMRPIKATMVDKSVPADTQLKVWVYETLVYVLHPTDRDMRDVIDFVEDVPNV